MFANQFKRTTRVKLRVFKLFILKLLIQALMKPFYERNAITRDGFTRWLSTRGPALYKTFFDLHVYLAGKYCENPRVPGVQLNVNPARAITWLL